MELLESIRNSLIEQSEAHGKTLYPSTNRSYINDSLIWDATNEGYLFWYILHRSYYLYGKYDYLAIIKLFILYGDEVFKLGIYPGYSEYDYGTNTLSTEGFEKLCKEIERYGIVRKHSEEFN